MNKSTSCQSHSLQSLVTPPYHFCQLFQRAWLCALCAAVCAILAVGLLKAAAALRVGEQDGVSPAELDWRAQRIALPGKLYLHLLFLLAVLGCFWLLLVVVGCCWLLLLVVVGSCSLFTDMIKKHIADLVVPAEPSASRCHGR